MRTCQEPGRVWTDAQREAVLSLYRSWRAISPELKDLRMAMANHPQCCKPGASYLSHRKNLIDAWSKCGNPFFVCWCLDFMVDMRLEPPVVPGDVEHLDDFTMKSFFMRPWRIQLYKDFLIHELGIWRALRPFLFGLLKNRKICLFLYWLSNGYADDRRNGYWWGFSAHNIKALRAEWIFLEVEKEVNANAVEV
jgi:hypothetical protein